MRLFLILSCWGKFIYELLFYRNNGRYLNHTLFFERKGYFFNYIVFYTNYIVIYALNIFRFEDEQIIRKHYVAES